MRPLEQAAQLGAAMGCRVAHPWVMVEVDLAQAVVPGLRVTAAQPAGPAQQVGSVASQCLHRRGHIP